MIKQLSWAGAAVACLLLVAVGRQISSASTPLKRMGDAARQVKSVHLIGWNCELSPDVTQDVLNGETQISATRVLPHRFEAWIKTGSKPESVPRDLQSWLRNGQWREAQDNDVTVYAAGKVWKNGVFVPGDKQPPLLTSFAYRAITGEDPFGAAVPFTTQILGETVLDGQPTANGQTVLDATPAVKFVVESRKQPVEGAPEPVQERRLFWLDKSSSLPLRMEQMRYNVDRWELDAVVWFDYGRPTPDSLFDPQRIRSEPHGRIDYTKPAAQALYHLDDNQYTRYTAILAAQNAERDRINAIGSITQAQRDELLVKSGAEHQRRLREIMTPDQQKLFDDWWYVQPKVLDKLLTPAQRQEDFRWHAEQKALMAEWFRSQDAETQQRLGSPSP